MIFSASVVHAEKKTKEQQLEDCNDAYDRCAKAADDWFESVDKGKEENIDSYGQMLDGCRVRKKWCKEEIKKTPRIGDRDANVPSEGDVVVEPEPPKKKQAPGRPATGGVSTD